MLQRLFLTWFLLFIAFSPAYSQPGPRRPYTVFTSQSRDTCKQLTIEMLQNATYEDAAGIFGEMTMTNGEYVANKEGGLKADLRYAAWGDLNSDGCKDVVLIIFSYQGGNDPDETLCAVLNNGGTIGKIICQPLDGYATDSIAIVGGVISIKMAIYEKGDAHCCPSKSEVWRFVVEGTEIKRLE
jgi:hypothetical protein